MSEKVFIGLICRFFMGYRNCSVLNVLKSPDFFEASYSPSRQSPEGITRIITNSPMEIERYLRTVIKPKVIKNGGNVRVYLNEGGFLDLSRSPILDRSSRALRYFGKFDFFQFKKSPLVRLVGRIFS